MDECRTLIPNITLQNNVDDVWIWHLNLDGLFSLKEACEIISNFEEIINSPLVNITSNSLVPTNNISLFVWRLLLDRLPTKYSLICIGMQILAPPLFLARQNFNESANHLFF